MSNTRTTISIKKTKANLLRMKADVEGLEVGVAAEAAITLYAGDPKKLAKEHTAKLVKQSTVHA